MDRMRLKFNDMRQIGTMLENTTALMGAFSTHRPLQVKHESLYQIISSCVGFMVNDLRSKGITLVVEPMFLPRVAVDRSLMMRVFYNLLRNAVKYSDSSEQSSYIKVYGSESDQHVAVRIEDNGVGVLSDEVQSIFAKYSRGRAASIVDAVGSGLGLYICREILRSHNGGIAVLHTSKPTVFVVTLPLNTRTS